MLSKVTFLDIIVTDNRQPDPFFFPAALVVMWLAGWVHRDISAGNILWLKGGRGILSDLEYAKKRSIGHASSDPKTVSYNICLELSLRDGLP